MGSWPPTALIPTYMHACSMRRQLPRQSRHAAPAQCALSRQQRLYVTAAVMPAIPQLPATCAYAALPCYEKFGSAVWLSPSAFNLFAVWCRQASTLTASSDVGNVLMQSMYEASMDHAQHQACRCWSVSAHSSSQLPAESMAQGLNSFRRAGAAVGADIRQYSAQEAVSQAQASARRDHSNA